MANLGNAWHLPSNPEPLGNAGMRDPVLFPTDPVPAVTVLSGNQFQGGGNPGNQLQDGSAVLFKQATDTAWQTVPLIFATAIDNNKYYSAAIPAGTFPTGTVVQYYLRIAYDDHATTFLQAAPGRHALHNDGGRIGRAGRAVHLHHRDTGQAGPVGGTLHIAQCRHPCTGAADRSRAHVADGITPSSPWIPIRPALSRRDCHPPRRRRARRFATPTGFVDTIRSGTMVYEERTGSGTGP